MVFRGQNPQPAPCPAPEVSPPAGTVVWRTPRTGRAQLTDLESCQPASRRFGIPGLEGKAS